MAMLKLGSSFLGGGRGWVVSRFFRTFDFSHDVWKVVGLGLICSGPHGGQSKSSGNGDQFGQPVHLEIAFAAPSGRGHMPKPCGDQHQHRVAIREGAHHARSASYLAHQPFQRVVGAQAAPVLRRQIVIARVPHPSRLHAKGGNENCSPCRCLY